MPKKIIITIVEELPKEEQKLLEKGLKKLLGDHKVYSVVESEITGDVFMTINE